MHYGDLALGTQLTTIVFRVRPTLFCRNTGQPSLFTVAFGMATKAASIIRSRRPTRFFGRPRLNETKRDQEAWRKLVAKGWGVIIVWECQLKKGSMDAVVKRIAVEIVQNGDAYRRSQEERRIAREEYLWDRKARKKRERDLLEEVQVR